jgi:hypothetical protein
MFRRVPLTALSEGQVFAAAMHDENLRQVLAPDRPVTADLLKSLAARKVRSVVIDEQDWARYFAIQATGTSTEALPQRTRQATRLANSASRELDAAVAALG